MRHLDAITYGEIFNDYILDLGLGFVYKGFMDDKSTKELLNEMVNLLTELTEEVAQLANPTAGAAWGRPNLSPGDRADNVRKKLNAVRAALARVQ